MDSDTSFDESQGRSRLSRIVGRIVIAVVALAVLFFLLLPGGGHSPESYHRTDCVSNLKQLGMALYNYHDNHKTFPPAYIADAEGKPMHSWRALLLPYCEDEKMHKLGEEYHFDEPWNGPHNRTLAAKAPDVFRCPSDEDHAGETNYVAVVGDQTIWPGANAIAIKGIGDGTSNTIIVVETFESGINWLEPRDVTFEQALRGIQAGNRPGISSNHSGGANVLFADGSVHFLPDDTPPEILRGLLTASGGEKVELPEW
jgi:prepilin-type processing-associated H-X9-DG protein